MSSQRATVLYPLLAALILRVAVPLIAVMVNHDASVFFEPYSPQYLKPAVSLVSGEGFTVQGYPELRRTPGYPLLLVPGVWLNHVALFTITLQVLLSCLTVYLVYRIGLLLFGQSETASYCAFLYAIEPLSVVFSSLMMPETVLTCAVSAFFYYLLQYLCSGSLRHLLASASAAAASAYISPVTLYLPLVIAVVLIAQAIRTRGKALVAATAVFLLVYVGLVGPWYLRNGMTAGYWGFSTIFANSMYYSVAGSVRAAEQDKPLEDVQHELARQLEAYSKPHATPTERVSFMRREGCVAVFDHPFAYALIHVKGMVRTLVGLAAHGYVRLFSLLPSSKDLRDDVLTGDGLMRIALFRSGELPAAIMVVTAALALLAVVFYSLALVGLLSTRVLWTIQGIALVTSALYLLVITGGPHGYSRYRHVIMPVVCVFAGYGLRMLLGWWKTHADLSRR